MIDFFSFTNNHFKKYPNAKIYHYAAYEITALERLTSLHKVQGIDYDHYLHLERFVDLYAAAGHPNCVFKIDYLNLKKITQGSIKEISE